MQDRLVRNLVKLHHKDYFMGSGAASQILLQLVVFLNGFLTVPIPYVTETNGCDYNPVRTSLAQRRHRCRPLHLAGNIFDRLPSHAARTFRELQAETGSTVMGKKLCNLETNEYLKQLYKDSGHTLTHGPCIMHPGRRCPM